MSPETAYKLVDEQYLFPTPAGAYYAVSEAEDEPMRRLLFALMQETQTRMGTPEALAAWCGVADEEEALELLFRAQNLAWVQGESEARAMRGSSIENDAPGLLAELSSGGCALLSDVQGFYLSRGGFTHEAAEELALLAAELVHAVGRRGGLLQKNLGISGGAWAAVDAAGNSQLGIWPFHIGQIQFCVTVLGTPRFNRPAFTELIWMIANRYRPSDAL